MVVYDWIDGVSVPVSEEEQAERDRIWSETYGEPETWDITDVEAMEILLGGAE